ncbi:MAG: hypothetical protein ACKVVT_00325 [Dehalococcoidia bacterium]
MPRTIAVRTIAAALLLVTPMVAFACGGDDDDTASTPAPVGGNPAVAGVPLCLPVGAAAAPKSKDFPESSNPAKNIPEAQRNKINLVVAAADLYVGQNNFVFGVTDKLDEPQGGAKTRATLYDLRDPGNPKPVCQAEAVQSAPGVGPEVTHVHEGGAKHVHGGEDDNRVGYFIRANLDHAGPWGLAVEAILKDGTRGIASVGFAVAEKSAILAPGQPAHKSDNLTKNDVAKIEEIDSGTPPNDMHDVKIKDAIAAGRPLVVVFSTPAYCTSRFCGPVNEEVEALHDVYKEKVDFVHIEIWRDRQKNVFNPTAQEWLLRPDGGMSEPYIYMIGKDGVIYDRFEGPVARNIMEPAVKAIAEGKVFAK